MNIEINLNEIKLNNKCKHEAYNKNCLVCMVYFSNHYKEEIDQSDLNTVIKEKMKSGLFINPDRRN